MDNTDFNYIDIADELGAATDNYDHPIRGTYINYHITCPDCRNDMTVKNAPLYEDKESDEMRDALMNIYEMKCELVKARREIWSDVMHELLKDIKEQENEIKTNS